MCFLGMISAQKYSAGYSFPTWGAWDSSWNIVFFSLVQKLWYPCMTHATLHCLLPIKARTVVSASYLISSSLLPVLPIASKSRKNPAEISRFIYESSSNGWTYYDNRSIFQISWITIIVIFFRSTCWRFCHKELTL